MTDCNSHKHTTKEGFVVECYHKCKNAVKDRYFWLAMTVAFPIEHFIWTKLPGFSDLAKFLGLIDH